MRIPRLPRRPVPLARHALIAATAAFCCLLQVQPAAAAGAQGVRPAQAVRHDAAFVRAAWRQSDASLQDARLARTRSRDVRVREFALRTEREHAALVARLGRIAGAHHPRAQAAAPAYGQLRGVAFDRRFVADRVARDRAAIALYQQEADSGRDAALVRFAAGTLPTLRRHLAAAEALQAQFDLRSRNFSQPVPD